MRPWLKCLPLSELIARYDAWQEEPYGTEIDNWRHGVLCSTIANVAGNKTKPSDFYPPTSYAEAPQTEQSPEHLLGMFRAVAKGMNK